MRASGSLRRLAHATGRQSLRLCIFQRHRDLALGQVAACGTMIFLSGLCGVDGLFFGLGLLLRCRLLSGRNCENGTKHQNGDDQRHQAAHCGLLRIGIVAQIILGVNGEWPLNAHSASQFNRHHPGRATVSPATATHTAPLIVGSRSA